MGTICAYAGSTEGKIPKTKGFGHLREAKEVGMHASGKDTC